MAFSDEWFCVMQISNKPYLTLTIFVYGPISHYGQFTEFGKLVFINFFSGFIASSKLFNVKKSTSKNRKRSRKCKQLQKIYRKCARISQKPSNLHSMAIIHKLPGRWIKLRILGTCLRRLNQPLSYISLNSLNA